MVKIIRASRSIFYLVSLYDGHILSWSANKEPDVCPCQVSSVFLMVIKYYELLKVSFYLVISGHGQSPNSFMVWWSFSL